MSAYRRIPAACLEEFGKLFEKHQNGSELPHSNVSPALQEYYALSRH